MNSVSLIGRLTRDIELKQAGETTVARFTLAVDRRYKKDGQQSADFISCVAFGKTAEFLSKYFQKGNKLALNGRIQTGSYDKNGEKVYTTDIIADSVEFCEGKNSGGSSEHAKPDDAFMNIPDDNGEEGLPFN